MYMYKYSTKFQERAPHYTMAATESTIVWKCFSIIHPYSANPLPLGNQVRPQRSISTLPSPDWRQKVLGLRWVGVRALLRHCRGLHPSEHVTTHLGLPLTGQGTLQEFYNEQDTGQLDCVYLPGVAVDLLVGYMNKDILSNLTVDSPIS